MADHDYDVVSELAHICRDGQAGFRDAAEHAQDPPLKSLFQTLSQERGSFANELESALETIGYNVAQRGTAPGTMHRAWMDLKQSLGAGDQQLLDHAEQGEDAIKEAYDKAVAAHLPSNLVTIITAQAQRIHKDHEGVRALREARRAA